MKKIKIGIVEDEIIIADDLRLLVQEMGYECPEPCRNYAEAVAMLHAEVPDLVLLDIRIAGKYDGIDLAKYIRAHLNIPFIYVTANADAVTVKRARETYPDAYLVKPFQQGDIYSAIEIALYNFNNPRQPRDTTQKKSSPDYLFVKERECFHKVYFDEILYLSSEHVYVIIHTLQKKFTVRMALQEYLGSFDAARFIRVHRGYVVNIDKVEKITSHQVIMGETAIPLSANYREKLIQKLNIV